MDTATGNAAGEENLLKRVPLFSDSSDSDLAEILEFSHHHRVAGRERLFSQGDACEAFFVLCSGAVKLVRRIGDEHSKVMDFIGAEGVCGEEGLFSQAGYLTTAAALVDSEVLSIETLPFTRYLQSNPRLSVSMMTHLTRRLARLVDRLESQTVHTAEQRVAAYLLTHRNGNGGGAQVATAHSRRDLASLLSITPETLSRTIGEFRRRNWITIDRRKIVVRDPAGLAQVLGASSARGGFRFAQPTAPRGSTSA